MGAFLLLVQFVFEPQIICNHRDKLAICGLSAIILDGISKVRIQRIHVASVPRDLDGVADGALHARSGGLVFLGDNLDFEMNDVSQLLLMVFEMIYRLLCCLEFS